VKLRTSSHWVGTWTEADVIFTLVQRFFVAAYGSMYISGSMDPWAATKKASQLYTSVAVTPAPVQVPTQWPLVPSFTSVVG
jgi:hypothetical protein